MGASTTHRCLAATKLPDIPVREKTSSEILGHPEMPVFSVLNSVRPGSVQIGATDAVRGHLDMLQVLSHLVQMAAQWVTDIYFSNV